MVSVELFWGFLLPRLSVSNDLRFDALRDLRDIGCHVKVHPLNKVRKVCLLSGL